jgi:N-acetylmuramoyl-L-alanine amidase
LNVPQHLDQVAKIVLHHSASSRDTTTLEKIREWHRAKGWLTVGYHFVIEGDGKVRHGRSIDVLPAAQKGANENTIAICLVGDNTKPGEQWSDPQKAAVRALVQALRVVLPKPVQIVGHRDIAISPTACPGLDVADVFPDLVSEGG